MKLQTIELKHFEIVETESGEFEAQVTRTERKPLMFTHRALLLAKREGILETGLEQELFKILSLMGADAMKKQNNGEIDLEGEEILRMSSALSTDHMKDLIWCAYVGAHASTEDCYDREDFKELYSDDFSSTLQVFMNLLKSSLDRSNDKNKFASGLKKFEGPKKKGEKK